jgi:ligand-binding SRPBCC domain-containing protein
VDEQMRGPFARFHHVHRFEPAESGTSMVDEVEFQAPFGPVGVLSERVILLRYIRGLIEKRNRYLVAAIEQA